MSQTTMSQTAKTAQQVIDEWVAEGDLDAELDLDGFTEIPKLPDTVRRLYADSATALPELPAGLQTLYADSATVIPELPAGL